ncbi:MAG: shikimate kinase [Bacteroidota bacterium]|nr:shikimate kinase [Candidatus Kapabacteria bacterium]MDW8220431.1 shikimate kinase [Bacteroidota bacterium]
MIQLPNLVFIGFRGTGKTTLSCYLAQQCGIHRCSTDELIVQQQGMSIAQLVAQYGWEEFRRLERLCIHKLVQQCGHIIDCGGGVVEDEGNMRLLRQNGKIIWIHAHLDDILQRLMTYDNDNQRPLLNTRLSRYEDIVQNYTRRLPLYERYAEYTVNTSHMSLEEACHHLMLYAREVLSQSSMSP